MAEVSVSERRTVVSAMPSTQGFRSAEIEVCHDPLCPFTSLPNILINTSQTTSKFSDLLGLGHLNLCYNLRLKFLNFLNLHGKPL